MQKEEKFSKKKKKKTENEKNASECSVKTNISRHSTRCVGKIKQ